MLDPMTSTQQFVAAIDAVLALHHQQEDFRVAEEDQTGALVAYGFASAAVHTAEAALHLYRSDFLAESMPQARLVFELGVTAQWVYLKRESGSVEAVGELGLRSIRLFGREARGAGWLTPEQSEELLRLEEDEDRRLSPMASELKNFESVCKAFTDGQGLYATYRAMSRECHAGGGILSRFIGDDGRAHLAPRVPTVDSWIEAGASTAIGVVLAYQAFDQWWDGHPHAAKLEEIASEIGMQADLTQG